MTIDESYVVNVEGAVYHDGRYLMLVRSANESHAPGVLATAGGKVENAGQSDHILEDTLRREIREEVGIDVEDDMVYVTSSAFIADDGDPVVNIVFLCRYRAGDPVPGDPDEVESLAWMTPEAIREHPRAQPWTIRYIDAAEKVRRAMQW